MPCTNCSVWGCQVSLAEKYKGVSLFKVPSGNDTLSKNWRDKIISIITKDRVIDKDLRERINKGKLWVCQKHFKDEQINFDDNRISF